MLPVTEAEARIPRFRHSDGVPLVAVAEHMTQVHDGVRILAQIDIQDALKGGCRSLLQSVKDGRKIRTYPPPEFWCPPNRLDWVNALNLSQRLADFPDRPWPWELHVALTASERQSLGVPVDTFLHRADAVRWGLWQESPRAKPQQQTRAAEASCDQAHVDRDDGRRTADGKRKAGRRPSAWCDELHRLIDEGPLDSALSNADIARQLIKWTKAEGKATPELKTILNVLGTDKKFLAWRAKK
jgi:hypothetical protein